MKKHIKLKQSKKKSKKQSKKPAKKTGGKSISESVDLLLSDANTRNIQRRQPPNPPRSYRPPFYGNFAGNIMIFGNISINANNTIIKFSAIY